MNIVTTVFIVYVIGILSMKYNIYKYAIIISLIAAFFHLIKRKNMYFLVLFFIIILAIINYNYNSKSVLKQYIDKEIIINAKIIDKKTSDNEKYNSYDAVVTNINNNDLKINEKTILYLQSDIKINTNSEIQVRGNVANIRCQKNKLVFNYENYLRNNKINTVIFCNDSKNVKILKNDYSILNIISENFKEYTEETFYSKLDKKNASIILSIILGDKGYLEDNFLDNIRSIGLAHIFAVSGLHIGILYSFFVFVLRKIGLSKKKSFIITWSILWIYGFLIGFPTSVLRTLLMFTVHFLGDLLYRKYNSINSLVFAGLVLLIINPFWIFDVGFQLSFTAALSLVIYSKYIKKIIKFNNKLKSSLYVFTFLQIIILPILSYHFNYIPLLSIIYNIIFIPAFSLVIITSFGLLAIGWLDIYITNFLFLMLNNFINSLYYFICLLNNIKLNGVRMYSLNTFGITSYYLFILLVFNIKIKENFNILKIFFTFFAIVIFFNSVLIPLTDENLYINIIDVGQGSSALVSYKYKNFIIDAGSNSNNKIGSNTLLPYMVKRGIFNIDGIFVSHWHFDHYSGIDALLEDLKIKNIYSGYINDEVDLNDNVKLLNMGDNKRVNDKLKFSILWPRLGYTSNNENNMSLVILIEYYNYKILFTGDIEKEIEDILINNGLTDVDILIVPHHGSKTSSTMNFVNNLEPEYSLISYGNNNYGIPNEEVIDRYKNKNSTILTTFDDGEIDFIINRNSINYNTYNGLEFKRASLYVQSILINGIILLMALYYSYLMRKVEVYRCEL